MSATLVFVLLSITLLVLFAYLATRRAKDLPDLDRTITAIRALDVEAFRNLVDPEEEEFLRVSLPAQAFRRIKRERSRGSLCNSHVSAVQPNGVRIPPSQPGENRSQIARFTFVCVPWMRLRS